MGRRSTVDRPGIAETVRALRAEGRTLDEITREVNAALADAGREEEQVSRSAVGRFLGPAQRRALEAKGAVDAIVAVIGAVPPGTAAAGRIEAAKVVLYDRLLQGVADGELDPGDAKKLTAAIRDLDALRAAAEQAPSTPPDGRAGGPRGLSRDGEAAIRAAFEAGAGPSPDGSG